MIQSTIVVSGGTGLVGSALIKRLERYGYNCRVLSTNKNKVDQDKKTYYWNPESGELDVDVFKDADILVHLAGSPVNQRWNAKGKEDILKSRLDSTQILVDFLKQNEHSIQHVFAASAIGWYPDKGKQWLNENHPRGTGFLADTVAKWEKAHAEFGKIGLPTFVARVGVVLSKNGGALAPMAMPVKLGFGAAMATGEQFMPWIHIDDLVGIFHHAIVKELIGTYNAVAPNPRTNRNFTKIMAKVLRRPFIFPAIPAIVLRFMLGERADILIFGARVSAEKIINSGYQFKFEHVSNAFEDLFHT
ncbi:MAG: TIGR01777 family oxidoreductase [Cryomorphaceae bacterium]|nr:TIGR01777 family oxidoreductase [Cryomorphaceae bacterium]